MANKNPRTPEEKERLSKIQRDIHERKRKEKAGVITDNGSKAIPRGGDKPTGVNPSGGSGGRPASSVPPAIPRDGVNDNSSPLPETGNNLEKHRLLKVVIDIQKIFKGLPAFMRLTLKAFNNLFKVISFIPFIPFNVEFEDMTPEEAELVAEVIKPGLEAALPSAAKRSPWFFLFGGFFVALVGKIKFTMKKPKE